MNLHEYQAKELLKKYNVPVQEGYACNSVQEAEEAYRKIKTDTGSKFAVIKAQIHAGGRGKGGGVAGAACMDGFRQSASLIAVPGDLLPRRCKPTIGLIDGLAVQHWRAIQLPTTGEQDFRLD